MKLENEDLIHRARKCIDETHINSDVRAVIEELIVALENEEMTCVQCGYIHCECGEY